MTSQPLLVQEIDGSYKGNGINIYAYTLGAYNPTFIDHLRNYNKALNRSTTTANVQTPQQTDIVNSDTISYSDLIVTTQISGMKPNGVYGVYANAATYGGNSYFNNNQVQYGSPMAIYGNAGIVYA